MLRGNWRIFLAAIGFLVAVLGLGSAIAWVLWPGSSDLPTYGWQETAYSDYEPGGTSCQPAEINRLRPNAKRASQREACENAAEQYRIQTNDLKQQTRAADAAVASVLIAEWQSKATVFGLIVGFYTLAAASAAAIFAKQAADETRRSAEAAESAVAEARRIGEAQVRCYASVGTVVLEFERSGALLLQLVVNNAGQSPAKEVRWGWRIGIRDTDTGALWRSPETVILRGTVGSSVSAGESFISTSVIADLLDDIPMRNALIDSTRVICDLLVDIEWQDVFGTPFSERLRFTADFRPKDKFGEPVIAERYTAYREEILREFKAPLA